MRLGKVLTGSVLSLMLLASASPAFAATSSNSTQVKTENISIQGRIVIEKLTNDFPKAFVKYGVFYIFDYSYYSNGKWYGVYKSV
ncbi:hypothetical protein MOF11_13300 [Bacillus haynesii]|uniref:hypothetical protein n=1 Tax=Bacillus haynesii TaxID=1925021 RepID=UPI002281D1D2|nr:hypothetical protein [Bacillus haynesii]MCY9226000.1 hypothetical protein [Bacillus haynesii]